MNVTNILHELKMGRKVRKTEWHDHQYIYLQHGRITNEEGDTFYISEINNEEWELYTPPPMELADLLRTGATEMRRVGWRAGKTVQVIGGNIYSRTDDSLSVIDLTAADWVAVCPASELEY